MAQGSDFMSFQACRDRRVGGIVGLLVGDALGVPYEFHGPEDVPQRELLEMTPPPGFRRAHSGIPTGTWSDDGAQALALLASLQGCGRFSLVDFADRLLRWEGDGYMAVDGHVFDIGIQTAEALSRLRDGVPARESGGTDGWDNGNGSLMRVLPLALWHRGSDEELVLAAHLSSLPTHGHPRSQVACAMYCLVARGYLASENDPWPVADERLRTIYADWPKANERGAFIAEIETLREFGRSEQPRGTGYVVDSLFSARSALREATFEDVAKAAISFGNDTDTTAAVACGLAGIRFGIDGVPSRWLQHLRGFNVAQSLLNGLRKNGQR
ncbi:MULTISPECIES: ADP-ribosylglycohydrolase family protein [unclassified Caballeronia]|uniref:ADP-ribosylglycohydrolase family protein n=1 Tax=unclassified Caballeronia TaxID=2646786 RepID=UPI001F36ABF7|nr:MULTISPECIES: ADP-ribosylglycohydrolase family protein [unclassified Caballeronia]MCE4543263.1 ADP-ribosylglycohydrolase family protein [Caballeronia sp. PC1]MCE4567682.1 ADP-ribosylglycohydrolase family protein [Caballeronia sp. CLC5]